MKVIDLIELLKELPENADILIHIADYRDNPTIYMSGVEFRDDENEAILYQDTQWVQDRLFKGDFSPVAARTTQYVYTDKGLNRVTPRGVK